MDNIKDFNLFEYNNLFSSEIQISYKGPFDKHVLAVIGNYIKTIIGKSGPEAKKIFKIFIELAQNISFYSGEKSSVDTHTGVGILVIRESNGTFFLHAGNEVLSEDVFPILDKCEVINSLDREGLRKYKREQRNLPRGIKGGAHIGLIQVALTSANPLDIKVTPVNDEYSFFSVTVVVNKIDINKEEELNNIEQ